VAILDVSFPKKLIAFCVGQRIATIREKFSLKLFSGFSVEETGFRHRNVKRAT
jgi:hypothetical protein